MTAISASLYRLTSSEQLDSASGEDGLIAFQLIRSDTFDSTIDPVFYTNEKGSAYESWVNTSVGGNTEGKVQLRFVGNANDTVDAMAQLAFRLPAIYSEIEVEYDLYVPSNYSHVMPSDNVDNNKFFRFWQTTYESFTTGNKCGASLFSNSGNSILKPETMHYGEGVGLGVGDGDIPDPTFILPADKGQWMYIKIHLKAPVVGNNYQVTNIYGTFWRGDGFIKFYKNGALVAYNETLPSIGAGAQGWKYGYIMGAANSGFRADTYLYIDNLVIRGKL